MSRMTSSARCSSPASVVSSRMNFRATRTPPGATRLPDLAEPAPAQHADQRVAGDGLDAGIQVKGHDNLPIRCELRKTTTANARLLRDPARSA